MKTRNTFAFTLAAAAILVIVLLSTLSYQSPATAAPMAAPTPVSVTSAGVRSAVAEFWTTDVITSDRCSPGLSTLDHEKMDLQYVIDVRAGSVNTTTFSLRHSNVDNTYDTTNWNTDKNVSSAISADGSVSQQYQIYNRWNCIYADVANTNPITVTFIGVLR